MLWTIAVWAERILAVSRGREQYSQPGALGHTQVHSSALTLEVATKLSGQLVTCQLVARSPVTNQMVQKRRHCGLGDQIDLSTSGPLLVNLAVQQSISRLCSEADDHHIWVKFNTLNISE